MQSTVEAQAKALKYAAEGYTLYRTCVQNLINIVYSEKSSSTKLRDIKKLLLTAIKIENPGENKLPSDALSDLLTKMTDKSVDFKMMEQFTESLQRATAPYVQFSELKEKIGQVIRTPDKTDDDKIDLITDILV